MSDPITISVNSFWLNLESLLAERVARGWVQIALGVSWGFGPGGERLSEYALPERSRRTLLRRRTGIAIDAHRDGDDEALERHLGGARPAIVAVDSHALPYRPAYGRVHSGRTVIVRRHAESRNVVVVDDPWPPAWRGALPIGVLRRARNSAVPLDRAREPVFAGVPLEREWWSVGAPPLPPRRLAMWLSARLHDLHCDATSPDGATCITADRIERLEDALGAPGEDGWFARRAASLRLRAEISPRAYMIALLQFAGQALGDTLLLAETGRYTAGVLRLVEARDVLVKSLALNRQQYARIVAAALADGARAERRLASALEPYRGAAPLDAEPA